MLRNSKTRVERLSTMKIKILIMLLFINLLQAENGCNSNVVKKLKNIYTKELQDSSEGDYQICKEILNQHKEIFLLSYKSYEDEHGYELSLVIGMVDSQTKKIEQSFFLEEIEESDSFYIDNIELDTQTFQSFSSFAIIFEKSGSSGVYPFSEKRLSIYKIENKTLKLLLNKKIIEELHGENNGAGKGHISVKKSIYLNKKTDKKYPILKFKNTYRYQEYNYDGSKNKEEKWEVDNYGYLSYKYVKGKYKVLQKKAPKLFELNQVEAQVKKGLRFKPIVLQAMLFEEMLMKKNVIQYNNIAYYLLKHRHYKGALVILEELVHYFPKRTVAYYNLGDAYWALGRKEEAKKMYATYVKQMTEQGKEKRIPKVVTQRIRA